MKYRIVKENRFYTVEVYGYVTEGSLWWKKKAWGWYRCDRDGGIANPSSSDYFPKVDLKDSLFGHQTLSRFISEEAAEKYIYNMLDRQANDGSYVVIKTIPNTNTAIKNSAPCKHDKSYYFHDNAPRYCPDCESYVDGI